VISGVRREGLTFLDTAALLDLYERVLEIERRSVPGIIIEAGCARGGSAIVMSTAKEIARPLHVYDTFSIIPPPSAKDGPEVHERYEVIASGRAGPNYYGYDRDLLGQVYRSFAGYGMDTGPHAVRLIPGLFEDTLSVDQPVALAHIDCDWYESTMTCLERIEPRLVPGGILVIDDYDTWSGCRRAVDEYFADKQASYEFHRRARLHIVKLGP
jgi:hypothetical protein